ncbi:hypothetical protein ABIA38_005549 [Embleya sp. AB8]
MNAAPRGSPRLPGRMRRVACHGRLSMTARPTKSPAPSAYRRTRTRRIGADAGPATPRSPLPDRRCPTVGRPAPDRLPRTRHQPAPAPDRTGRQRAAPGGSGAIRPGHLPNFGEQNGGSTPSDVLRTPGCGSHGCAAAGPTPSPRRRGTTSLTPGPTPTEHEDPTSAPRVRRRMPNSVGGRSRSSVVEDEESSRPFRFGCPFSSAPQGAPGGPCLQLGGPDQQGSGGQAAGDCGDPGQNQHPRPGRAEAQ